MRSLVTKESFRIIDKDSGAISNVLIYANLAKSEGSNGFLSLTNLENDPYYLSVELQYNDVLNQGVAIPGVVTGENILSNNIILMPLIIDKNAKVPVHECKLQSAND